MTRTEHDALGAVTLPNDALWGAQTQRSLHYFRIGHDTMPLEVVRALAWVKRAACRVNAQRGALDAGIAEAIVHACDEVIAGEHDAAFPLSVWQTGSGTQSNMNANEVIAHRAIQLLGGDFRTDKRVSPNDHVNMAQSSNDVFPTAMHLALVLMIEGPLYGALTQLHQSLARQAQAFAPIIKIGRTHMQDATPLSLGQEFSGYAAMLEASRHQLDAALASLRVLAIGATAVGTGLNAPVGFGAEVCAELSAQLGTPFVASANPFHGLTSHDAIVFAHGALKALAANLFKIANDIRLLGSGPRAGLGELLLPENEPGSSIMPGKVNPTQSEMLTMVATQVMGNDAAIGFAASQGHLELNVFKPLIIHNALHSVRLLGDGMRSFAEHCVDGIAPNHATIARHLGESLMLVTALNPVIGYKNAATIARKAHEEGTSLRDAALQSGLIDAQTFDRVVRPEAMIHPQTSP